jgi:hypothetical protein
LGNPIADTWIYATVHVENERGGEATGFLVPRETEKRIRVFLVTNKHVLGQDKETRANIESIKLHLNVNLPDGQVEARTAKLALATEPDGRKSIREHPEADVDVVAIDVSHLIYQYPEIKKKLVDYAVFGSKERLKELDVTIGDDVMIIGYPHGIRHHGTAYPFVRAGIIASRIGERLEDEVPDSRGGHRKRTLRGFLLDGGIIPGSSGSPVVLKPIVGRRAKRTIMLDPPPAILLGIVAETRYAPIHIGGDIGDTLSFAGLGLAFDAETIKETVELFFH